MLKFGDRLRDLRIEKGLTQKELASLIGCQNSIISFYENGDRFPTPEVIIKLAAVFRVSTDYLLGVERGTYIDASGLDAKEIKVIRDMIDILRKKK